MRFRTGTLATLLATMVSAPAFGGDPFYQDQTQPHLLQAFRPAGGWNPYGGGLFHWWDPQCFDRPCGPDDYCRKPLPRPHCSPRPVWVARDHGHSWLHGCPNCASPSGRN